MKIGYFSSDFPYKNHVTGELTLSSDSGVENVTYNLAVQMAKRGYDVYVFSSSKDQSESIKDYGKMFIYQYKKSFTIGSASISVDILYKPLKLELNLDVIHAHAGNPPAPLAAYWYAKKKDKPFVVTYHGDPHENMGAFTRRMSVYFYNKFLLDKVLSHADVIISPSEYYIEESRFLVKYRDKIVVIPNGVTIEDFDIGYSKKECREKLGLSTDSRIILFVGTLGPHKGPDVLLKSMAKILKEVPDAKLVFVGSDRMKGELERLANKLGIEKHIQFAGFVEEDVKPLYYMAADVFCLPSTMSTESFGIVNLEAMACGVPIVASKIGGVPDVVKDGENGLLVPPRDSEALADAIIYLLENEDIREKMGKNGRKKVENYSWERIGEMTEKVYKRLV